MIEFLKNMVGQLKAKVAKVTKGIDRMIDFLDHPIRTLKTMEIKNIKSILINIGKCLLCIVLWTYLFIICLNWFMQSEILNELMCYILLTLLFTALSLLLRFKWYTYLISFIPSIGFVVASYNISRALSGSENMILNSISKGLHWCVTTCMGITTPSYMLGSLGVETQAFRLVAIVFLCQICGNIVCSLFMHLTKMVWRRTHPDKC